MNFTEILKCLRNFADYSRLACHWISIPALNILVILFRYLYTGQVQFEMNIGVQLLLFCRECTLSTMQRKVTKRIIDGLKPENACLYLPHVDEFPEIRNK